MGTDRADILSRHPVSRHRITLEDYHRLGQAGILGEDDRVELLDGQLVDMSPIGPRHALAVDALTRLLVRWRTQAWSSIAGPSWSCTQGREFASSGLWM